jgi:hypothetical protein
MDALHDFPLVPDIEDMIPLPKNAAEALPSLSPNEEIEMRARTIKLISDLSSSPIIPTAEEQDMAHEIAREMVVNPKNKVEYAKYPNEVIAYLSGLVRETNHALVDDLADYKTFVITNLVKEYASADDPKVRLQALTKLGEVDGVDAFKKRSEVTHVVKPIEEVEKELLQVLENVEYTVVDDPKPEITQRAE